MLRVLLTERNLAVVLFGGFLLVPWLGANPYVLFIATLMLIQIILALGLNILIGFAGQLAFANAAMFGIGAYGSGLLQKHFALPFWFTAPVGAVAATAVGTLLVLPALRLSGMYLALTTLAFAQCAIWVMMHWTPVTFGASGFTITVVDFSPLPLTSEHGMYLLALICCVLLLVLARNIVQSPIGRAFVALRDHEIAAQALGVDLLHYKVLAFALSGFYAGVAGVLYSGTLSFVGPESFGVHQMVLQLAAVVMGGIASITGSVIGGIVIVLVQEVVREFKFSIEIVFGALLLLFVLLQPAGLVDLFRRFGRDRRERLHWPGSGRIEEAALAPPPSGPPA
jgi:branched-chain amino acid transport system permease protein